jgi:serine protease inhibitor
MPNVTEFRVDQPFVFIISERTSSAVLFAGKIENPLKENLSELFQNGASHSF